MPVIDRLFDPMKYSEIKSMRKEYLKNKYLFVSLAYVEESVAKKIKDYFLGITYVKKGMAFQFQKTMLYILDAKYDPNDITQLSSFLWKNGLYGQTYKSNPKETITFRTIGLISGDKITFNHNNGEVFLVEGGNCVPMVKYLNKKFLGTFSLRLITRRLLGGIIPDEIDIFSLWHYKGKTLRILHNKNMARGSKRKDK